MRRSFLFCLFLTLLVLAACSQNAPTGREELETLTYEETGTAGCTPGYWKNHTESWPTSVVLRRSGVNVTVAISPTTKLGEIFGALNREANVRVYGALKNDTLLAALNYKATGSGLAGAAQRMLRQAVAGLLSEATLRNTYFAPTATAIMAETNLAINSQSAASIERWKDKLDLENNRGCPL